MTDGVGEIRSIMNRAMHDEQPFGRLSAVQFEELVAFLLTVKGYQVEFTRRTHDGSHDLLLHMIDPLGADVRGIVENTIGRGLL